jgi:hypothetical protein
LLANGDVAAAEDAIKLLDQRAVDLRTHTTGFLGMPVDNRAELAAVATERAQAEKSLRAARSAKFVASLLIVRWTVPLLAALLLWFCWAGKPFRPVAIAAGAAGLVTAVVIYAFRQSLVGGGEEGTIAGALSRQMDAVISVGIGVYLMGIVGVGLILVGLGIVRAPLAARAA